MKFAIIVGAILWVLLVGNAVSVSAEQNDTLRLWCAWVAIVGIIGGILLHQFEQRVFSGHQKTREKLEFAAGIFLIAGGFCTAFLLLIVLFSGAPSHGPHIRLH